MLQVRLFEEEPSYCSYGEAYDINCARFGREPDMPIAHFKKRLAAPDGNYDKVRGRIRRYFFHVFSFLTCYTGCCDTKDTSRGGTKQSWNTSA
jgi:hypothetical protein